MHLTIRYFAPVAALLVLLTGGCQTGGMPDHISERDLKPLRDSRGHARSLALSTPDVLAATPVGHAGYDHWSNGRNDELPSVIVPGARSSVTYIRDEQNIFNGRIYDRFEKTTYEQIYRD